jgi:small-conductance mechanosensitive channel
MAPNPALPLPPGGGIDGRGTMTRLFRIALVVLALLASTRAGAQSTAPGPGSPAPSLTQEQARQALDVLNDPKKRAEVAATLEAIIKAAPPAAPAQGQATPSAPATPVTATPGAKPAGPTTPLGLQLAPNSLGADLLVSASKFMTQVAERVGDVIRAAQGAPQMWDWLVTIVTDPLGRQLLAEVASRLAVTLAAAFAAMLGTIWLLRPSLRRVAWRLARLHPPELPDQEIETGEARAEHGEVEPPPHRRFDARKMFRRMPLVFARLGIELAPILAFLVIGHVVAGSSLGGSRLVRLVLEAVIDSIVVCSAVLRLARAVLAPRYPRLRLIPLRDATAWFATRWIRRVIVVGVTGYAIAEVGLLLGLSRTAHLAILKAVLFLEHVLIAIIVLQVRRGVREWIRAPQGTTGLIARLRNSVAATWHWFALLYLAVSWLAWAVPVPAGYQNILRGVLTIVAVFLIARLVIGLSVNAMDRAMAEAGAAASPGSNLSRRFTFYHPFLVMVVQLLVYVVALLLYLELMGVPSFAWLTSSPLGTRVSQALASLALTILIALTVWEIANAAMERHLSRLTSAAQVTRAARLRTLLPILRAALLVVVLTVAGLLVLSEVGVNTAPLLASAGIIGVAIGFGSQKLVQDVITGLFLLLENAMKVGDWVTVAGLSGTVEHLSVRTIRLRAADGSVHIIPFSSVSSVSNTNRGLGNAAVSVTIAYHEDTDRVCDILRDIARGIRAEPAYQPNVLGDLQIWGVDRIDGASVTITGQIPCTDSGRWGVQREFNRRVKLRFVAEGIALFDPTRTYLLPLGPIPAPARPVGPTSSGSTPASLAPP